MQLSHSNHLNISVSHVTYSYPDTAEPLFEDASATFSPGWTAVLGDNGIGKTTLIRIVLGELTPDAGTISPAPGSYLTAYCAQETSQQPSTLDDFANDWSAETLQIRDALGIGDDWAWRYDSLSGGEKKRLQVACALAQHPDVLVLDEPTNHVDATTRQAIAAAMAGFKNIGILISHDATLLDAVAERCLFFERRHTSRGNRTMLTLRTGNYTQASEALRIGNLGQSRELQNAKRTAARVDSVKADRVHEAAQAFQKRRGDKIDPKDRDAFAKRGMAIYTGKDGRAGAASARIDSQVAAAHAKVESMEVAAKRYDGELFIGAQASHRREVVHLEPQTLAYDPEVAAAAGSAVGLAAGSATDSATISDPTLGLTVPELSVGPRDHIAVTGRNGTGKTTLITRIHEQLTSSDDAAASVPFLFIPQETTDEDTTQALHRLGELSAAQKAQVLSGFAQLNSDPNRILAGEAPSPGELRKLLLCLGIVMDNPELIIMDEPTNHLDLNSKRALAQALCEYPGSLLVVSHETWFLDKTTSIRWTVQ